MSELESVVGRLVHDVAKYVARTAKNLDAFGDGPVPEPLVRMLAKDLYALDGARRASVVYRERAAALAGYDATLSEVSGFFEEIDALEGRVVAGESVAVHRAASLARAIESSLRGLARRVAAESSEEDEG